MQIPEAATLAIPSPQTVEPRLREDKSAPIFMAGLGTGLAPFRVAAPWISAQERLLARMKSCGEAYIEQRKYEKSLGHRVGPMTLFFGGRHKKAEFYYQDEPGATAIASR